MQVTESNEDCRAVHARLLGDWLGETDEVASSVLLDHVSTCRSCLKRWIALQAAADLALCAVPLNGERFETQRWRPTDMPGTDGAW